MELNKIKVFLEEVGIFYKENINLARKTWIKRGGIANIWVQPNDISKFENLIIWCQTNDINFEIIGSTSNCYFLNDYNPLLVISTLKLNKNYIRKNTLVCECGFQISHLSKFCNKSGFDHYYDFIKIPGTIGAAVINNSGSGDSLMSKVVKSARILENGKVRVLNNNQLEYKHRTSVLKENRIIGIVLDVTFNISEKNDPNILCLKAENNKKKREKFNETTYPNLGTIFSVCEFKPKSLPVKLIKKVLYYVIKFTVKNTVMQQKYFVNMFLLINLKYKLKKYVSDSGIRCFVWKDKGADKGFIEYVEFMKNITSKLVMEVEIKGDHDMKEKLKVNDC